MALPDSDKTAIEQLDLEPQKVYLTFREYKWGGEYGKEVIGVSATYEVAENVEKSFLNMERHTKRNGEPWTRGDTVQMDVEEWDVHGTVPPPAVTRTPVESQ